MTRQHHRFTVAPTRYRPSEGHRALAIHFQAPAADHGDGARSLCMRSPILLVTEMVDAEWEFAMRVARILEKHWDDPDCAKPAEQRR